jgi:hypothetical protein
MFIIPYVFQKKTINSMVMIAIELLTIGGVALWEESATSDVEEILLSNDLHITHMEQISHKGDIGYLCVIDTAKTNMADFYKWDEINKTQTDLFCWRKFYLFGNKQNETNWLPVADEYYKDLIHTLTNTHERTGADALTL